MHDLFDTFQEIASDFARGFEFDSASDIERMAELENTATRRAITIGDSPCELPDWIEESNDDC